MLFRSRGVFFLVSHYSHVLSDNKSVDRVDSVDISVGGIERDITLINKADIDITASTFSPTNKLLITNLVLKPGKTGFLLQGIKQVNSLSFELVKKDLSRDAYKHTMGMNFPNSSLVNKTRLDELNGASIVTVVETKYKGLGYSPA